MRRSNRASIALGIRRNGPISRAQLAELTGLTVPCICGLVAELIAEGTIVEVGSASNPRGRPTRLLDINANGAPVAGVLIGSDQTDIVLANLSGQILARKTMMRDECNDSPEVVVPQIAQGIRQCSEAAGKDPQQLTGVGVVASGFVSPVVGVIEEIGNRPGWENLAVVRELESHLSVPVFLDNDARAAINAVYHSSERSNGGESLFVMSSDGIGTAMILSHGHLLGPHDIPASLKRVTMEEGGPSRLSNTRDTGASIASDFAFIHELWPDVFTHIRMLRVSQGRDYVRQGVQLALDGDKAALAALTTVTGHLATAIANVTSVLDIDRVIVSGTLVDSAPDYVMNLIRKQALQRMHPEVQGVEITGYIGFVDFLMNGAIGLVLWQRDGIPTSRERLRGDSYK